MKRREFITLLGGAAAEVSVYAFRFMVAAGGLVSYGADLIDQDPHKRPATSIAFSERARACRPAGAGADQV